MKRNHGLDLLKAICSFMVICIHAPFPGLMGKIIIPLTRIAVPLFFMITGYYHSSITERKNERKQLNKIFRLFVGSNLLFFAWSLLKICLSSDSIIIDIGNMLSVKSMLKFILLNDSPFGGHLWYLSAILYVFLIVIVFEKKWDRRKLYPIVPFLLLADIVFGKYSLLLLGRTIPYIVVRNFFCVGLPYFLIGDMLYVYNIRVKSNKAILFILVFAFTTLVERFLLGNFHVNAERDHYISTTFLAVFVFLLAVQHEQLFKSKGLQAVCCIGATLSSSIYILHPIVITVLGNVIAYVSRYIPLSIIYSFIAPFVIYVFTTIASWVFHKIAKKKRTQLCYVK